MIRQYYSQMILLNQGVNLETLLKQKKERADKISAEVIPEIMESMKLKTSKLLQRPKDGKRHFEAILEPR